MNARNLISEIESFEEELIEKLGFIKAEIRRIGNESISWSVDDFLQQALLAEKVYEADPNIEMNQISMKNAHKYLRKYDPDKFQDALEVMVDKHDAGIGITWDTVDVYLDDHCIKEEPV